MLCYHTTGSNQAIEIRGVKEKEFDPFAKAIGKCTQGCCKKEEKKAMRKMCFATQKLLTNIKLSSGQRKEPDVSRRLIALLQTYLSHRLSPSAAWQFKKS